MGDDYDYSEENSISGENESLGSFDSSDDKSRMAEIEKRTELQVFLLHTRLLMVKNLKLFWRSKMLTLFQIFTPIMSCILIIYFQHLAEQFANEQRENPTI